MSFYSYVHLLYSSALVAKQQSWHKARQKHLFQLLLLLRHWLQFLPNPLVIPFTFRAPAEHEHTLPLTSWSPIAQEEETLARDKIGLVLVMVVPISVFLSCHTSKKSTTSQSPWTCWIHWRTKGCCGCALCDASFFPAVSIPWPLFLLFLVCCLPHNFISLWSPLCLSRRWSRREAEEVNGYS